MQESEFTFHPQNSLIGAVAAFLWLNFFVIGPVSNFSDV